MTNTLPPTLERALSILRTQGPLSAEDLYFALYPGRVLRYGYRGAAQGGPSGPQTAVNFLMGRRPYRDHIESRPDPQNPRGPYLFHVKQTKLTKLK